MTPPPDLTDAEKRCEICGRRIIPGISESRTLACYRIGYQRLRGALERIRDEPRGLVSEYIEMARAALKGEGQARKKPRHP